MSENADTPPPMNAGITAINEEVERASAFVQPLLGELGKVIIGQKLLVER